MKISYEGIDHLSITMPAGECVVGQVCDFDSNGKIRLCPTAGKICGIVEAVENEMAAVQVSGFVKQSYSRGAPSYGYVNLVGDGYGGVMVDNTGKLYMVVEVDTENQTVVFKL